MKKNKLIENIKLFIKENYKQLIFLILLIVVVSIELPYYIEAPGGTINITKRIDSDYSKKDGSLNMLYVTHYKGNVVTVILGKIFNNWDINKISNQDNIENETITVTFVEGKNMRWIATKIANSTNNTEQDVFDLLKDTDYIDSLINDYWFITDAIKNKDINPAIFCTIIPIHRGTRHRSSVGSNACPHHALDWKKCPFRYD